MKVTLFRDAYDSHAHVVDVSWEHFIGSFVPAVTHDKLRALVWSPTEFDPEKGLLTNPKTGRPYGKSAETAGAVSCGVLDLDDLSASQFAEVLALGQGLDRLVYSTYKHGVDPAKIRARHVVRFTRPVEPYEWPRFWPALNARFGGLSDAATSDISRVYFGAFTAPDRLASAFSFALPGDALDVDELLKSPDSWRVTPGFLKALAERWDKDRSKPRRRSLAIVLRRLADGEPFADPGERDSTLWSLLCAIVSDVGAGLDRESLIAAFGPSLAIMQSLNADCPGLEIVREKLARLLPEGVETAVGRIAEAFASGRTHGYSEHELTTMAERCGCTRPELDHRWIIQKDRSYYVLFEGDYRGPYTKDELVGAVARDLAPAPLELLVPLEGQEGKKAPKTPQQLVLDYGTVAERCSVDLSAQRTRYDAEKRELVEVGARLRDVQPKHDEEVDAWLHALARDRYEIVATWLANVTRLDRPYVALLFTGAKGAGKSLFAHGIARLWTEDNPTELGSAIANFNDALVRCPVVLADETIPKHVSTEDIRAFIQARTRPLKRKFLPEATVRGAVRIVIAANREDILQLEQDLTEHDVRAITERIVHVPVSSEAERYLRTLSDQGRSFVFGDRLAAHALWLRDNHSKEAWNGRFGMGDDNEELFSTLINSFGIRAQICQWITGWIMHPERYAGGGVCRSHGRVWISVTAIQNGWGSYLSGRAADTARISQRLKPLTTTETITVQEQGRSRTLRAVDLKQIKAWALATETALPEEIERAVGQ